MIETEPTRELAAMLAMSGRVTSALKVYDTLLGRDGDNAEFWLQKGLLHQDLSDFVAARQALERARAVAPGDARIHFHLGLLAASFGRMLAAVEHFRSAQTLDPDKGAFKVYLANALFCAWSLGGGCGDCRAHGGRAARLVGESAGQRDRRTRKRARPRPRIDRSAQQRWSAP